MVSRTIDAYVVTSGDPHQSEYPPERWRGRAWISGFTGSAGTVVVTADRACLWVDFRYYLQAEQNTLGTGFEVFRHGLPRVPDYPDWIASELGPGSRVGVDASTMSVSALASLTAALAPKDITVVAGPDLLDDIWTDRPGHPAETVTAHEVRFAGQSRGEKLSVLRARMAAAGATHHLIATLDDIAWLFNLRGSDVAYNPVFLAYALITNDDAVLFVDHSRIEQSALRELEGDGVTLAPYDDVIATIGRLERDAVVLYSAEQTSAGLAAAIPSSTRRLERINPTSELKARKTAVQAEQLRATMARDGEAMVRFIHWLVVAVRGGQWVSEMSATAKLLEFRSRGDRFESESFHPISGYRGHGAIVHYAATDDTNSVLEPAGLYLIDSGAQYLDGTTDITRTIALGDPGEDERRDFTLVLKAHIALATLTFPVGTTGHMIDAIARHHLWNERLNYGHGTGHGVGFYLNVHEGPHRISSQPNSVALEAGMVVSNEPGIYRPERYGIRIENLLMVVDAGTSEFGAFRRFETLTVCPIDRTLIETALLTDAEREWIDEYHRHVRDRLLGRLEGDVAEWLERACAPLLLTERVAS